MPPYPIRLCANIALEYNETQCDKRNTYRRKVKEEKAAAAAKEGDDDEAPKDGESAPHTNGNTNGHVSGEGEDEDRPAKKFKAEDGSAIVPDPDGSDDDEMDQDEDGPQDGVDDRADDDVESEGAEDEIEEDDEDDDLESPIEIRDPRDIVIGGVQRGDVQDEALDDFNSDSDE